MVITAAIYIGYEAGTRDLARGSHSQARSYDRMTKAFREVQHAEPNDMYRQGYLAGYAMCRDNVESFLDTQVAEK